MLGLLNPRRKDILLGGRSVFLREKPSEIDLADICLLCKPLIPQIGVAQVLPQIGLRWLQNVEGGGGIALELIKQLIGIPHGTQVVFLAYECLIQRFKGRQASALGRESR